MHETPLKAEHAALGAKFVEFGGWNMPVWYSSGLDEHHAVRQRMGLFDLCHMGRLVLSGPRVKEQLSALVPTDLDALEPGQAKYSFFLTAEGGFVDDILIYARERDYFVVVNASNREAVLAHLAKHFKGTVTDETARLGMIAVQGPRAVAFVDGLTQTKPSRLAYYSFTDDTLFGVKQIVARTGYTGEDGFELYLPVAEAGRVWRELLAHGKANGLVPCGLAARDTLRLEASMALYGHEISLEGNPVEAKLGWAVAWDKPDFMGARAIRELKAKGTPRTLVGLEVDTPRVPRQGQSIWSGDTEVGVTTSGTASPTLEKRIAMAYVRRDHAAVGTALSLDIRGHRESARVVKLPFYKRSK